jgi:hypothetical protein
VIGIAFTFSFSLLFGLRADGILILGAVYVFFGLLAFFGALKRALLGHDPFPENATKPEN